MENQEKQTTESSKVPASSKPYNLEPNMEAALAYLLTPITGVLVFMLEKDNKFVRFHAMQSIIFGAAVFVAWMISVATSPILIGLLLAPIVSIGSFILWLVLMYKAYSNEEWELPYLGKIARDQLKNK